MALFAPSPGYGAGFGGGAMGDPVVGRTGRAGSVDYASYTPTTITSAPRDRAGSVDYAALAATQAQGRSQRSGSVVDQVADALLPEFMSGHKKREEQAAAAAIIAATYDDFGVAPDAEAEHRAFKESQRREEEELNQFETPQEPTRTKGRAASVVEAVFGPPVVDEPVAVAPAAPAVMPALPPVDAEAVKKAQKLRAEQLKVPKQVSIEVEHSFYAPGDIVSGIVVVKPSRAVAAPLFVSIAYREAFLKTSIFHRDGHDYKTLWTESDQLWAPSASQPELAAGSEHKFKFEFDVPIYAPPSSYSVTGRVFGVYRLQASFSVVKSESNLGALSATERVAYVSHEKSIDVQGISSEQQMLLNISPPHAASPVTKGHLTIKGATADRYGTVGQKVTLELVFDNGGKGFSKFNVFLMQRVLDQACAVLKEERFGATRCAAPVPAKAKGHKVSVPFTLPSQKDNPGLFATYVGKFVSLQHLIVVEPKISMRGNPMLHIPINLVEPLAEPLKSASDERKSLRHPNVHGGNAKLMTGLIATASVRPAHADVAMPNNVATWEATREGGATSRKPKKAPTEALDPELLAALGAKPDGTPSARSARKDKEPAAAGLVAAAVVEEPDTGKGKEPINKDKEPAVKEDKKDAPVVVADDKDDDKSAEARRDAADAVKEKDSDKDKEHKGSESPLLVPDAAPASSSHRSKKSSKRHHKH